MIINTDWYKCHGKGWTGIITPESFAHPAKFSRALIRRIYAHALEQGYIAPGSVVVDPFAGVSLGALHAMQNGLHWVGMELEEKFVVLGRGIDCPGFDVAFYRRYQQRGTKWLKLGVCPECARALDDYVPFETFFGTVTRKIPHRGAHRYRGNIGKWEGEFDLPGTATLLQGDSRRLAEVLGAAGLVVSSPPYEGSVNQSVGANDNNARIARKEKAGVDISKADRIGGPNSVLNQPQVYGFSPGQLGAMTTGNHTAVIGSPPYAETHIRNDADFDEERLAQAKVSGNTVNRANWGTNRGAPGQEGYGNNPAQMAAMPTGDPAAVVSSPVYPGCLHGRGGIDADKLRDGNNPPGPNSQALIVNEYGHDPAQLGAMVLGSPPHANARIAQEGGGNENNMRRSTDTGRYGKEPGQLAEMVLGSLPYAESLGSGKSGIDWSKQADRDTNHPHGWDGETYGKTDNQLGGMKAGDIQAVLGSPPYAESLASDDPDKRGGLFRDPRRRNDKTLTAEYGKTPGQLAAMRVGALMSSPPFEESIASDARVGKAAQYTGHKTERYGLSPGQLGQEKGDTFWQAAQTIMRQCYQILSPGSVAIWVLKAFVRDKKIVDFPGQWQQLGEACGFETVEVIRAWLIEDRGNATALFDFDIEMKQKDGSVDVQTIERGNVVHDAKNEVKSASLKRAGFFRNLYEKKYPGNEIDFEIVLIQRRPL